MFSPLKWVDGELALLDQRELPAHEVWRRYGDAEGVSKAIRQMVVRGAPAIGCAAALGLAASARHYPDDPQGCRAAFGRDVELLRRSRPTAVNLFWAIDRQTAVFDQTVETGVEATRAALEKSAVAIWCEDIEACRAIGRHGAELIPDGARVLTHCNAGALATGGYGTALGVIRAAVESNKKITVYADETRPFWQGARLTAWELRRSGIEVVLICDNMAGALMQGGEITHCVVGADRIARNGDVANKIGTYMVAVLAARHQVPFFVAAPRSTLDPNIDDGSQIPIEQRPSVEVTHVGDTRVAAEDVRVRNIAFDVTPADLVTAIITESGIARAPYGKALTALSNT